MTASFAALAFLLLSATAEPEPVFQSTSKMVLVPVSVTDRYAKTIEGLRQEDFAIFDNQVAQQIASFGVDDAPCSVGIVLDISGSMRRVLPAAKDLLEAFFGTANPADEFLLLTVSTQPAAAPRFSSDINEVEGNIGVTAPGGMTALLDTTYMALQRMKEAHHPRRALLILSDGIDNNSRHSQGELINLALEADTQVYTMIFDTGIGGTNTVPFRPGLAGKPWDIARERQGPELLEKLSTKTGGLYFHVRSDAEAKEAVVKTGRALRSEYLIGFQPSDAGVAGKWHQIRVKSNVPKVYVHARNGYYSR